MVFECLDFMVIGVFAYFWVFGLFCYTGCWFAAGCFWVCLCFAFFLMFWFAGGLSVEFTFCWLLLTYCFVNVLVGLGVLWLNCVLWFDGLFAWWLVVRGGLCWFVCWLLVDLMMWFVGMFCVLYLDSGFWVLFGSCSVYVGLCCYFMLVGFWLLDWLCFVWLWIGCVFVLG